MQQHSTHSCALYALTPPQCTRYFYNESAALRMLIFKKGNKCEKALPLLPLKFILILFENCGLRLDCKYNVAIQNY